MIQQLQIKNFQSHVNNTLTFDKGVNVVVGPSDSGKTAVIRALRWGVWNKPGGETFRSTWGGDTSVAITLGDGGIVARMKGKENKYVLDETVFKAFGANVPVEITQALNMTEVNIQEQMDSPFLLSETPGRVAAHFNKIANLSVIDTSIQNIQKQIRGINATIIFKQEDLLQKQTQLKGFDILEDVERGIRILERKQKQSERLEREWQELNRIVLKLEGIKEQTQDNEGLLADECFVDEALLLIDQKKVLTVDINGLNTFITRYEDAEVQFEENKQLLELGQPVTELLELHAHKRKMNTEITALSTLVSKYTNVGVKVAKNAQKLTELEKVFHDNFPSTCPLCGNKTKDK